MHMELLDLDSTVNEKQMLRFFPSESTCLFTIQLLESQH